MYKVSSSSLYTKDSMVKTYRYTGDTEIHLNGYGMFKPGQEIKSIVEINHPLFIEVKETKKKEK